MENYQKTRCRFYGLIGGIIGVGIAGAYTASVVNHPQLLGATLPAPDATMTLDQQVADFAANQLLLRPALCDQGTTNIYAVDFNKRDWPLTDVSRIYVDCSVSDSPAQRTSTIRLREYETTDDKVVRPAGKTIAQRQLSR